MNTAKLGHTSLLGQDCLVHQWKKFFGKWVIQDSRSDICKLRFPAT